MYVYSISFFLRKIEYSLQQYKKIFNDVLRFNYKGNEVLHFLNAPNGILFFILVRNVKYTFKFTKRITDWTYLHHHFNW